MAELVSTWMNSSRSNNSLVWTGNICRSTMAEGIFNNILKQKGLQGEWLVDSAATSNYQIGNSPDSRADVVMRKHGIIMQHRARQITKEDYTKFKYIFGMDKENIRDLERKKPAGSPSQILMLGKYDSSGKSHIIQDPYFDSDDEGFDVVFEQCQRSCENFLNSVNKS